MKERWIWGTEIREEKVKTREISFEAVVIIQVSKENGLKKNNSSKLWLMTVSGCESTAPYTPTLTWRPDSCSQKAPQPSGM